MISQKDAVVQTVKSILGSRFVPYKDIALAVLTPSELESVKVSVGNAILAGTVTYGKDVTNTAEVRAYARSMVMNHLKKAKELNGNASAPVSAPEQKDAQPKTVHGINMELLPEELKELVNRLQVCG